jgi:hypothetical protein
VQILLLAQLTRYSIPYPYPYPYGVVMKCDACGTDVPVPDRVSVYGMYDCHLFHRIPGASPDEIIENWHQHNIMDNAGLGPTALCPVIVIADNDKELRRVGPMVMPEREDKLDEWREALLADPDVMRLLAGSSGEDIGPVYLTKHKCSKEQQIKLLRCAVEQITVLAEFGTTGPGKCHSRALSASAASSLRRSISDICRDVLEKTSG